MERKIGEVFFLDDIEMMVIPDPQSSNTFRCEKCSLMVTPTIKRCQYDEVRAIVGHCNRWKRKDKNDVQFVNMKNNKTEDYDND